MGPPRLPAHISGRSGTVFWAPAWRIGELRCTAGLGRDTVGHWVRRSVGSRLWRKGLLWNRRRTERPPSRESETPSEPSPDPGRCPKGIPQQGYSGARIDKIARRAKANMRMIYHYFGNKEGLYLAVLENAYDHILRMEAKVKIDIDRPLDGVLNLLKFVYDYFENNPAFESLLRTENMMKGKFVLRSQHVTKSAFPLRKVITDLIESGTRQKIFRENLDPVQVYVTILALSRFHLANAYSVTALLGTDLTQAQWRKERFEHARDLLMAYLLAPRRANEN